MENNNFVQDSELVDYINAGIAELHDILVQEYGEDYYVSSKEFNTTSSKDTYPINDSTSTENINISDFYKLRGIDAKINGNDWFTIAPFNFNERNLFQNWGSWSLLGLSMLDTEWLEEILYSLLNLMELLQSKFGTFLKLLNLHLVQTHLQNGMILMGMQNMLLLLQL